MGTQHSGAYGVAGQRPTLAMRVSLLSLASILVTFFFFFFLFCSYRNKLSEKISGNVKTIIIHFKIAVLGHLISTSCYKMRL